MTFCFHQILNTSQNLQASIFDIFRKHHITGDHGVPLGGIGYGNIHICFRNCIEHKVAMLSSFKILYYNFLMYKTAG